MGVFDVEFGLALSAAAVDGGDEADSAGGELLVEAAQFLAPVDNKAILAAEVAGHALGAAGALVALPEALEWRSAPRMRCCQSSINGSPLYHIPLEKRDPLLPFCHKPRCPCPNA